MGATRVFFATRAARLTTLPAVIRTSACTSDSNIRCQAPPPPRGGGHSNRCPQRAPHRNAGDGAVILTCADRGPDCRLSLAPGGRRRRRTFLPRRSHRCPTPTRQHNAGSDFARGQPLARLSHRAAPHGENRALLLTSCSWG